MLPEVSVVGASGAVGMLAPPVRSAPPIDGIDRPPDRSVADGVDVVSRPPLRSVEPRDGMAEAPLRSAPPRDGDDVTSLEPKPD